MESSQKLGVSDIAWLPAESRTLRAGRHVLRKTTASAIYNKRFDDRHNWASTAHFGQNYANGQRTNSILFESNYDFDKNAVFGRFERVQKSGHDLVLAPALNHNVFWVGSMSMGYFRGLVKDKGMDVGRGGMATINTNPTTLTSYYGGTTHGSWQIFLRFRPSKPRIRFVKTMYYRQTTSRRYSAA